MKNQPRLLIGLVVTLILGLSAFIIAQTESGGSRPNRHVLVILKTLSNPYFAEMVKGIEGANNEVDPSTRPQLLIKAGQAEGDSEGQRRIMESTYAQLVANNASSSLVGVLLTPASSGPELVPAIKQFRDKNIPVIIVDTAIGQKYLDEGGTTVTSLVASSNEQGAKDAGEMLLGAISGAEPRILLLNGLMSQETAQERRKGFMGAMAAAPNKGVKPSVTERSCDWELSKAQTTMEALLKDGKSFDGIFAANDQMALGVVTALRQQGISPGSIPIVGFDAIPDAKEAVLRGDMLATMAQNPEKMGRDALEALLSAIKEKTYIVPVVPFTRENHG